MTAFPQFHKMATPMLAAQALAAAEANVARLQAIIEDHEEKHMCYRVAIRANVDAALVTHKELKAAEAGVIESHAALYTSKLPTAPLPVEIFRRVLDYMFAFVPLDPELKAQWASHDDIIAEFLKTCRNASAVLPPVHLAAYRLRAWHTRAWYPIAKHNGRAARSNKTVMPWNRIRRAFEILRVDWIRGGLPWRPGYLTESSMARLVDLAVLREKATRLRCTYKDCPTLEVIVLGKLGILEVHHPRAHVIAGILDKRIVLPSMTRYNGHMECVVIQADNKAFYVPYPAGNYTYHMGHGGRVAVTKPP